MGQPEGAHIHYQSFNFAGQHYTMGDCVYLLPEEEGSQPYIGRLMRAYEDTTAKEAERLVIEVRVHAGSEKGDREGNRGRGWGVEGGGGDEGV